MSSFSVDWTRHSSSSAPRFVEILLAILFALLLLLTVAHPAAG